MVIAAAPQNRQAPVMRFAHLAWLLFLAVSACRESPAPEPSERQEAVEVKASEYVFKLAPLINPDHLDSLKGKRAATPRFREACYWLEMARRDGHDMGTVIDQSHALTGPHRAQRLKAQKDSLIHNVTILERLGCLDEAGMSKLRTGNAPTITLGDYTGEIATADHAIPRSVCEELDECLFNLEFVPLTINQRKGSKIGQRQIDLARRWPGDGLLSAEGLEAVLREAGE